MKQILPRPIKRWNIAICFMLLFLSATSYGQVITYTENFAATSPTTLAQITTWNAWRASLIVLPYYKLKVTGVGTAGTFVKECNDPVIVQDIALKLNTMPGPVTTMAFTWVDGANTWQMGTDIYGRLGVNMTLLSNCDNPGYVIKPGIGHTTPPSGTSTNANWGGWGTATCGSPQQTVTIEFWYGAPCPVPTNLNASNILSTSATVSWSAVSGSIGYEYVVDQNAGNPPGAGTPVGAPTANVGGLTASSSYYLHVRNKCSSTSISAWVHYPFTTLPPCSPPINFSTANLTDISSDINWDPWPSALSYDYVVNEDRNDPSASTGFTNTAGTTASLTGLLPNTWYFAHIRSQCHSETSDWSLDSFLTPIICRKPELMTSHINVDEAVVYWNEVPTAVQYEYAITKSSTPPDEGTKYDNNAIHTSALSDGQDYYVHVRAHCVSVGVKGMSDWATTSFKTFPLNISSSGKDAFSILCYPNPVTSQLTIETKGQLQGNPYLTLTDITGRTIQTVNIVSDKTLIEMSNLAKGTYILKYADGINTSQTMIQKL